MALGFVDEVDGQGASVRRTYPPIELTKGTS